MRVGTSRGLSTRPVRSVRRCVFRSLFFREAGISSCTALHSEILLIVRRRN